MEEEGKQSILYRQIGYVSVSVLTARRKCQVICNDHFLFIAFLYLAAEWQSGAEK